MTGPKILVADIERVPGRFKGRYRGLETEGDFWSLSDYQRIIGRIRQDDVTEWPQTVCAAYRFIGKKRVQFTSVWDHGAEGMHQILADVIGEADIAVGHNFKSFDLRHIKTGWLEHGIEFPSLPKVEDTLTVARRELGTESRSLDALTKRFGLSSKTDKYNVKMARDAVAGVRKAQKTIQAYNVGDIEASEALYLFLRPIDSQAVHYGLYDKKSADQCRCGSTNLKQDGKAYTAAGVYQKYQCRDCGRYPRGKHAIKLVGAR